MAKAEAALAKVEAALEEEEDQEEDQVLEEEEEQVGEEDNYRASGFLRRPTLRALLQDRRGGLGCGSWQAGLNSPRCPGINEALLLPSALAAQLNALR